MQSSAFTCTQCQTPLTPGAMQCANCGLTFSTPVPYPASPGYAAPAAKKSPVALIAIIGAVGCLPMIAIIAAILFPVFAKARDKARIVSSQSNLKQLGLASMQFAQDHDEKLPPMDSMEHFKAAVNQYLPKDEKYDLFTQPGFNTPYTLNAKLSNKSIGDLNNMEGTVMMQETKPYSDKKLATLYADGHVRRVSADNTATDNQ
ncbi:MAG: prepilin-type N-terminal cleavage/methylation domain [Capsulimonas sp.]|nr:prepilin-type N-terminal cleavage/methylation domain [Capsulimonas sp.]